MFHFSYKGLLLNHQTVFFPAKEKILFSRKRSPNLKGLLGKNICGVVVSLSRGLGDTAEGILS